MNDRNNSVYYEDLKTYLESAANGADHGLWNGYTTINPQSSFVVLDTKSLVQMSGAVLAAQYFNMLGADNTRPHRAHNACGRRVLDDD